MIQVTHIKNIDEFHAAFNHRIKLRRRKNRNFKKLENEESVFHKLTPKDPEKRRMAQFLMQYQRTFSTEEHDVRK